jgi:hypothetical protein
MTMSRQQWWNDTDREKQKCVMLHAALHTVSFVHGCFAGKCILTGSTEWRYFKVDSSMEKKSDTVIPAT